MRVMAREDNGSTQMTGGKYHCGNAMNHKGLVSLHSGEVSAQRDSSSVLYGQS
jgi:hypothetical protein